MRDWCEALLGSLGLTALFVGGAVLPQALDAACPALVDTLGLGLVLGGAGWRGVALHAQVRRKVVVMRNDGNDVARLVGRLIAWLVLTVAVLLPAAVVAVLVRAVLWGFGIG